ncbi:hypothetical protein ACQJBY_015926 [Aegilops geniculata]
MPSPSAPAAAFSPRSGLQQRPSLSRAPALSFRALRPPPSPELWPPLSPRSGLLPPRAPASSLPALQPPPSPRSGLLALLGLVALLLWSGRLRHRAPSAFLLKVRPPPPFPKAPRLHRRRPTARSTS